MQTQPGPLLRIDDALLLFLWREISRHIELAESGATIASKLSEEIGLTGLRIDKIGVSSVDTLFSSSADLPRAMVPIAPKFKRELLAWAERHQRSVQELVGSRDAGALAPLLGDTPSMRITAGPLIVDETLAGIVYLYWPRSTEHDVIKISESLLEPFAAAVANDFRLGQLKSLQSAAVAERNSLLSRLGRDALGDDEVIGAETGLKSVMERVSLVVKSDVPVLILGETGTGKEVISRAIHTRSPRASGPFIRVNCGAIPTELIDSQLFGHEKGSFTGASEQHQGWFERADGGTLFLDEIGELPLAAQVRLLRVLQDHHIERVGGKKPIHVDVRIIAATHRDLSNMVKLREFREDLWYRINVFPIMLPRLRDRIEDIPALAHHFAHRAAKRFGLSPVEPSQQDLITLANYPWPGNIRELGAVMDRAAILGNGRTLEVSKALGLSQEVQTAQVSDEPTFYEVIPESSPTRAPDKPKNLVTLDEAMRQHIQLALVATNGRIEGPLGAAQLLGINPHTLRARMRKLGVEWNRFRVQW